MKKKTREKYLQEEDELRRLMRAWTPYHHRIKDEPKDVNVEESKDDISSTDS